MVLFFPVFFVFLWNNQFQELSWAVVRVLRGTLQVYGMTKTSATKTEEFNQ